jgi:pantetheine-phosphate adenylyltransferase
MAIGVYPGSFDPITKGHLAVIRQALKVVDKLYVIVGFNPDKKGMFDIPERVSLIVSAISEQMTYGERDRIAVDAVLNSLTVEYAKIVDANVLIRGLRNGADYAYERSLAAINRKLAPDVETVFIPTPAEFEEVSSSTVKGLMKYRGGEVAARDFVTPNVLEAIRRRLCES